MTFQRECLFGEIVNREMKLNEYGRVVDDCWRAIPQHYPYLALGAYVVMPNHVHGIISIIDQRGGEVLSPRDNETKTSGGEPPPLK